MLDLLNCSPNSRLTRSPRRSPSPRSARSPCSPFPLSPRRSPAQKQLAHVAQDCEGRRSLLSPVKIPSPIRKSNLKELAQMNRSTGMLLFPESPMRRINPLERKSPAPQAATAPPAERRSKRFDMSDWQIDLDNIETPTISSPMSASPETPSPLERPSNASFLPVQVTVGELPPSSTSSESSIPAASDDPIVWDEGIQASPFTVSGPSSARRTQSLKHQRSKNDVNQSANVPHSASHGSLGPFTTSGGCDPFGPVRVRPITPLVSDQSGKDPFGAQSGRRTRATSSTRRPSILRLSSSSHPPPSTSPNPPSSPISASAPPAESTSPPRKRASSAGGRRNSFLETLTEAKGRAVALDNVTGMAINVAHVDRPPTSSPSPNPSRIPMANRALYSSLSNARRVASMSNLAGRSASPFDRPGTVTTPGGGCERVHPSVHSFRNLGGLIAGGGESRKRNANGAIVVGGVRPGGGSRLALDSPLGPSTSSSPHSFRDPTSEDLEDEEDDDMEDAEKMGRKARDCWSGSEGPGLTHSSSTGSSVASSRDSALNLVEDYQMIGEYLTPQNYKNVKPLQAAFMSTGLITKRARGTIESPALASPFANAPILGPLDFASGHGEMPDTPCKRPILTLPNSTTVPVEADSMAVDRSPLKSSPSETSPCSGCSSSFNSDVSVGNGSPTPQVLILPRPGPVFFRRRSSGQLPREVTSQAGSPTTTSSESEPMTPTRVGGEVITDGAHLRWLRVNVADGPLAPTVPQLAITPSASPDTATFPFPMASPALGQLSSFNRRDVPLATPVGPRPSLPLAFEPAAVPFNPRASHPPHGVRPSVKHRHSGSIIHALRQQEISSPDRFESTFTIIRSLGTGESSEAYAVMERQTGNMFAVKRTKLPFGGPKDRLRRLEEVDILRSLSAGENRCPNVLTLTDAWEQSGHLFIQTELCEYGNLAHFLTEYGRQHEMLDEARVWKMLAELSQAVHYVHSHDVLHLDIKPANVFITEGGSLKLGDFGLATRWPRIGAFAIIRGAAVDGSCWSPPSPDDMWEGTSTDRRQRVKSAGQSPPDLEREGDREYIAPEVLGSRYGKEADLFSLGLITLEAATNVVVPDNGLAWRKLRSNDFSDVDLDSLSQPLSSLIRSMMEKNPDRRLTSTELVSHPIVSVVSQPESHGLPSVLGAILPERESFVVEVFRTAAIGRGGDDDMDVDG